MHYYKREIGHYHAKAGRLSMLEHGAYTLLLDSCYNREAFPTREQALDWCWARSKEEVDAVDFVLSKFFTLIDGVYVQKRIEEEVRNYQEKCIKNKHIAEEREQKRRASYTKRVHSVNEVPPESNEAPPNHKPITNNHKPNEKKEKKESADNPINPPDYETLDAKIEVLKTLQGYMGHFITSDHQPFVIWQCDLDLWRRAYPSVNVQQALIQIAAWFDADYQRKKPHDEMKRFIAGWLQRETDKCKAR